MKINKYDQMFDNGNLWDLNVYELMGMSRDELEELSTWCYDKVNELFKGKQVNDVVNAYMDEIKFLGYLMNVADDFVNHWDEYRHVNS